MKFNKQKVNSLNMPEQDFLLSPPMAAFMSMPEPPPHSKVDDLAELMFAKRHESDLTG